MADPKTNMDSKHYELQSRVDKLETQKSTLLRELDDLEEHQGKTDKLYKTNYLFR